MTRPNNFTWVEKPLLAAMAAPQSAEELHWLRKYGIQILLSLTEDPPRHDWIEEAGLLLFHVPMTDMEAPSLEQLDRAVSALRRAAEQQIGAAVHCGAGLGRTGVVLACFLVSKGVTPTAAIARIRQLRPGSVETSEQAAMVAEYARHLRNNPPTKANS